MASNMIILKEALVKTREFMMYAGISITSELKSVIQTNEKFRLKFELRK
jgi:hypothetical protein